MGQSIQLAGAGEATYNDVHEILVIDGDVITVDIPFVATDTGTWNLRGAKGLFVGFLVMNAVLAADITKLEFKGAGNWGDPKVLPYIQGLFYPFPGIITKIILDGASTADLRMIRYRDLT